MNKEQFKAMFLECLQDRDFCDQVYRILDADWNFTTLINNQNY